MTLYEKALLRRGATPTHLLVAAGGKLEEGGGRGAGGVGLEDGATSEPAQRERE